MNDSELDPKKINLIEEVTDFIIKRRLELPAILFIESTKPIHFIGAQFFLFFEPFLDIVFRGEKLTLFRECMEDIKYINLLVDKLEEGSNRKKKNIKK